MKAQAALDAAVQQQFNQLFNVLMSSDLSPEAYQRFMRGVNKLTEAEAEVKSLLNAQTDMGS